ncbi:MAG TPA: ECF-type sigma factor [Acidobacteriota bacterium]|nr:ECF-type sigma factor [Acidobacteriota bacterium]
MSPATLLVINEEVAAGPERDFDLVTLDDALEKLQAFDARAAQLVELRFFGGLTIEETSEVMGLSPATIKREWSTARAWLHREVVSGEGE